MQGFSEQLTLIYISKSILLHPRGNCFRTEKFCSTYPLLESMLKACFIKQNRIVGQYLIICFEHIMGTLWVGWLARFQGANRTGKEEQRTFQCISLKNLPSNFWPFCFSSVLQSWHKLIKALLCGSSHLSVRLHSYEQQANVKVVSKQWERDSLWALPPHSGTS